MTTLATGLTFALLLFVLAAAGAFVLRAAGDPSLGPPVSAR